MVSLIFFAQQRIFSFFIRQYRYQNGYSQALFTQLSDMADSQALFTQLLAHISININNIQ